MIELSRNIACVTKDWTPLLQEILAYLESTALFLFSLPISKSTVIFKDHIHDVAILKNKSKVWVALYKRM